MRRFCCSFGLMAAVAMFAACSPGTPGGESGGSEQRATDTGSATSTSPVGDRPVIRIETTDYAFTAPPTFPSGWVTLELDNRGAETHFALLWQLPEGRTFGEFASQIAMPFNTFYKQYRAGTLDQEALFRELGAKIPEWFPTVKRRGGPGFTAPGRSSRTTVYLEPGDYVIECYVRAKEESDSFHNKHGMLRPLVVTEASVAAQPPEADVEITLRNYRMTVEGEMTAGRQTVRVRVEEEPEGLILHNVQLAALADDQTPRDAAAWLDWVDHLLPPAPVEYLGGAGQVQAGMESYFTVDLAPGRYAWVSETWGVEGMVHEFIVE